MSPAFIERLTELPRIAYVKESTGEMPRITELIRRCGRRLGVFCGCDTLALESLVVGAIGWVGGVVNVLPAAHVQLYATAIEQQDIPAARDVFLRHAAFAGTDGRGWQVHTVCQSPPVGSWDTTWDHRVRRCMSPTARSWRSCAACWRLGCRAERRKLACRTDLVS